MNPRRPSALPDIADDDFRRRLDPLAQVVVPAPAVRLPAEAAEATSGAGEGARARTSAMSEGRSADYPARRSSGALAERIAAITRMEEVRTARGPKKGVEFLLPERIVAALKVAAAQEGTSMTVKVLEALRAAGYPVSDADFVDLRKLPRR